MSVWREVQEAIYARLVADWLDATPYCFANEPQPALPDPPGAWLRLRVVQRPGGQETLGSPGNRKFERRGAVYAILQEPPGNGVGSLSDLAENAKTIFEAKRLTPHGIRFEAGQIGDERELDGGRWWGVTAEVPFAYEELK